LSVYSYLAVYYVRSFLYYEQINDDEMMMMQAGTKSLKSSDWFLQW